MKPILIRWRLNDPSEGQYRWTKTHRVSVHASDLTTCHTIIPAQPYMVDYDEQIPTDWPRCKRCARADE